METITTVQFVAICPAKSITASDFSVNDNGVRTNTRLMLNTEHNRQLRLLPGWSNTLTPVVSATIQRGPSTAQGAFIINPAASRISFNQAKPLCDAVGAREGDVYDIFAAIIDNQLHVHLTMADSLATPRGGQAARRQGSPSPPPPSPAAAGDALRHVSVDSSTGSCFRVGQAPAAAARPQRRRVRRSTTPTAVSGTQQPQQQAAQQPPARPRRSAGAKRARDDAFLHGDDAEEAFEDAERASRRFRTTGAFQGPQAEAQLAPAAGAASPAAAWTPSQTATPPATDATAPATLSPTSTGVTTEDAASWLLQMKWSPRRRPRGRVAIAAAALSELRSTARASGSPSQTPSGMEVD